MRQIWKSLYIHTYFFYCIAIVIIGLTLSYVWPVLFFPARLLVLAFVGMVVVEVVLLFRHPSLVRSYRGVARVISLGDANTVTLQLVNQTNKSIQLVVFEELPYQLQLRDMSFSVSLKGAESKTLTYTITPKQRGVYNFYNTNIFIKGSFSLFQRRVVGSEPQAVAVYPSVVQIKKFQLHSSAYSAMNGLKKIRRVGHNYEFDHVKNYIQGDDYRSINWKATGKKNTLMVNQYDDERSQMMYSIVDTGRSMKMPFAGQTLLDYSINTSLVLSHIANQKFDNAGLITFSKDIHSYLKAEANPSHLSKIYQSLYAEKETDHEANFDKLLYFVRKTIKVRSLLFLFTNFETTYSLQRVLPILRMLNKFHLLVVVMYENKELKQLADSPATELKEIYPIAVAEKLIYEKKQLQGILRQHKIQSIVTQPEDLTLQTINKYLELKSRGLA